MQDPVVPVNASEPYPNPDGELECATPLYYSTLHGRCLSTGDLGHGCEHGADILLLLDGSEGVGVRNFEKLKQITRTFVSQFSVGVSQTRFAVVQYNRRVRVSIRDSEVTLRSFNENALLYFEYRCTSKFK